MKQQRHADADAHAHAAHISLLMRGALTRLAGAGGLVALLWLAVAWALGEPG